MVRCGRVIVALATSSQVENGSQVSCPDAGEERQRLELQLQQQQDHLLGYIHVCFYVLSLLLL